MSDGGGKLVYSRARRPEESFACSPSSAETLKAISGSPIELGIIFAREINSL